MAEAVEASKLDLIQSVFPSEMVFHRGMWCEANRKLKCVHMGRNARVFMGTEKGRLVKRDKIQSPHLMRKLCTPIYSRFNKVNTQ